MLNYGKLITLTKNLVGEKSISSVIDAHNQDLGYVCVNADGTLIATASVSGTRIKIWSSDGGELI